MTEAIKEMYLWIPIVLVAVGIWLWIRASKRAGSRPEAHTTETGTHVEPEHHKDDHHPAAGGGHGHDDHHGHGGGGLLKWGIAILVLVLVGWFLVWPWLKNQGFGQVPGVSAEVRYAMAPQGTIPGRGARASEFVCPVLPSTWQQVVAPSNEFGLRSETLDVPICHRIRFCDRKRDPHCMATSFAGSRFNLRCATPTSRAEHEFVPGRDRHSTACSVQSNSSEDIKLVFRYEFDASR